MSDEKGHCTAMKPKMSFAISVTTFALAICIWVSMLGGVSSLGLIFFLFHVFSGLAFVSLGTGIHSAFTIKAARWFLIPVALIAMFSALLLAKTYMGGGGPCQLD